MIHGLKEQQLMNNTNVNSDDNNQQQLCGSQKAHQLALPTLQRQLSMEPTPTATHRTPRAETALNSELYNSRAANPRQTDDDALGAASLTPMLLTLQINKQLTHI